MARDDTQGHHGQDHGHTHGAVDPSLATSEASRVRRPTTLRHDPCSAPTPGTLRNVVAPTTSSGAGFGAWASHPRARSGERLRQPRRQAGLRLEGTVHRSVYADDKCVGWCQYGTATELPNIKNQKAYAKDLGSLPDWRIGCIFTDKSHRGQGVARAAVAAALAAIKEAGGGIVEAYPEQVEGRSPQRGSSCTPAPNLFESSVHMDRRIANGVG